MRILLVVSAFLLGMLSGRCQVSSKREQRSPPPRSREATAGSVKLDGLRRQPPRVTLQGGAARRPGVLHTRSIHPATAAQLQSAVFTDLESTMLRRDCESLLGDQRTTIGLSFSAVGHDGTVTISALESIETVEGEPLSPRATSCMANAHSHQLEVSIHNSEQEARFTGSFTVHLIVQGTTTKREEIFK